LLLSTINPAYMRLGVGVLLVLFSIYGLAQPKLTPVRAGAPADGGAGFLNGVVCGLTGLPGLVITIWCQLRAWPKDVQRAIFQPVILGAFVVTAISVAATGVVTADIVKLYLLGLPALLAGLWLGFKLYGKLDEVMFRKVILVMLFFSGWALLAAQVWPLLRHDGG
jgi:uncharacterized membrane protein YfcA